MTIQQAIATIVGAAIFPFLIRLLWGKLVENFGPFGGFMAGGWIVGTTWCLNHGTNMITQSADGAWVDMGLAAGIGLLVASVLRGGKFGKAVPNVVAAIVGGVLGGLILSLYLPK